MLGFRTGLAAFEDVRLKCIECLQAMVSAPRDCCHALLGLSVGGYPNELMASMLYDAARLPEVFLLIDPLEHLVASGENVAVPSRQAVVTFFRSKPAPGAHRPD